MINPMDLSGKHILITGASSGIGRATCILCSQLGAKVSMIARNEERLKETLSQMEGEGHAAYAFDLTQIDGIEKLLKHIVTEQGLLDGFVHCAGITSGRPVKLITNGYLAETMQINFASFVEFARVLSGKRITKDGASIVAISSVAALGGGKAQGAYAASKAAIIGMIHPISKELGVRKIRINSIAFGMINTDMYQTFLKNGGDEKALIDRQYLGVGEPIDAANTITFLLSDASRLITGTTLVADGGYLS